MEPRDPATPPENGETDGGFPIQIIQQPDNADSVVPSNPDTQVFTAAENPTEPTVELTTGTNFVIFTVDLADEPATTPEFTTETTSGQTPVSPVEVTDTATVDGVVVYVVEVVVTADDTATVSLDGSAPPSLKAFTESVPEPGETSAPTPPNEPVILYNPTDADATIEDTKVHICEEPTTSGTTTSGTTTSGTTTSGTTTSGTTTSEICDDGSVRNNPAGEPLMEDPTDANSNILVTFDVLGRLMYADVTNPIEAYVIVEEVTDLTSTMNFPVVTISPDGNDAEFTAGGTAADVTTYTSNSGTEKIVVIPNDGSDSLTIPNPSDVADDVRVYRVTTLTDPIPAEVANYETSTVIAVFNSDVVLEGLNIVSCHEETTSGTTTSGTTTSGTTTSGTTTSGTTTTVLSTETTEAPTTSGTTTSGTTTSGTTTSGTTTSGTTTSGTTTSGTTTSGTTTSGTTTSGTTTSGTTTSGTTTPACDEGTLTTVSLSSVTPTSGDGGNNLFEVDVEGEVIDVTGYEGDNYVQGAEIQSPVSGDTQTGPLVVVTDSANTVTITGTFETFTGTTPGETTYVVTTVGDVTVSWTGSVRIYPLEDLVVPSSDTGSIIRVLVLVESTTAISDATIVSCSEVTTTSGTTTSGTTTPACDEGTLTTVSLSSITPTSGDGGNNLFEVDVEGEVIDVTGYEGDNYIKGAEIQSPVNGDTQTGPLIVVTDSANTVTITGTFETFTGTTPGETTYVVTTVGDVTVSWTGSVRIYPLEDLVVPSSDTRSIIRVLVLVESTTVMSDATIMSCSEVTTTSGTTTSGTTTPACDEGTLTPVSLSSVTPTSGDGGNNLYEFEVEGEVIDVTGFEGDNYVEGAEIQSPVSGQTQSGPLKIVTDSTNSVTISGTFETFAGTAPGKTTYVVTTDDEVTITWTGEVQIYQLEDLVIPFSDTRSTIRVLVLVESTTVMSDATIVSCSEVTTTSGTTTSGTTTSGTTTSGTTTPSCWAEWGTWESRCKENNCVAGYRIRTRNCSSDPDCVCDGVRYQEEEYEACSDDCTTTPICGPNMQIPTSCEELCNSCEGMRLNAECQEVGTECDLNKCVCSPGWAMNIYGVCVRENECGCYDDQGNRREPNVEYETDIPCYVGMCNEFGDYVEEFKDNCCDWNSWSDWNDCNPSCGAGATRNRTRTNNAEKCEEDQPGVETEACTEECPCEHENETLASGETITYDCYTIVCEDGTTTRIDEDPIDGYYTTWTQWNLDDCQVNNCRDRYKSRTKECVQPVCNGTACNGPDMVTENERCNDDPCCEGGWAPWEPCSKTCYTDPAEKGVQVRQYVFNRQEDSEVCDEPTENLRQCGDPCLCDVHQWSEWRQCGEGTDDTCGWSTETRERQTRTVPGCETLEWEQSRPCYLEDCVCTENETFSNTSMCEKKCNEPLDLETCASEIDAKCICEEGMERREGDDQCVHPDECKNCVYQGVVYPDGAEMPTTVPCYKLYCEGGTEREEPKDCSSTNCDLRYNEIVPDLEDPCCPFKCVPRVTCQKHTENVTVTFDGCPTPTTVERDYCSGGCGESRTAPNPVTGTMESDCKCCQPVQARYVPSTYMCGDVAKPYQRLDISSCDCNICTPEI